MSILSLVYLIVLIAAVIVSLVVRRKIKLAARPKWFWRLFYLVAAAMVAGVTFVAHADLNAAVSGYFIAGMFWVFAFWQSGLSDTSVINKLNSIRQFQTLSAIQLIPLADGCQLQAMVGSVAIMRLRFSQSPEAVATFLQTKMESKRVIIVH